jgi:membrane protein
MSINGPFQAFKYAMTGHRIVKTIRASYELIRDSIISAIEADFLSYGAALAYYTAFAIAPLFVIALAIAGFWFGPETASRELFGQVNQLMGKEGSDAIQAMVTAAEKDRHGVWATVIAAITLVVASVGVFTQLQNTLNRLWSVQSLPGRSVRNFIRHRLLSFAMVLVIGFLLLVSLLVSAGLSALGNYFGQFISGPEIMVKIANPLVSLFVITILFTLIFKLLPDVLIAWRDAWFGGFVTAVLFNGGKFLIGFYIARSSITSVYGAVGSLIIVLAWVYYSALILFFGAQMTRHFANRFGVKAKPIRGAIFMKNPTLK